MLPQAYKTTFLWVSLFFQPFSIRKSSKSLGWVIGSDSIVSCFITAGGELSVQSKELVLRFLGRGGKGVVLFPGSCLSLPHASRAPEFSTQDLCELGRSGRDERCWRIKKGWRFYFKVRSGREEKKQQREKGTYKWFSWEGQSGCRWYMCARGKDGRGKENKRGGRMRMLRAQRFSFLISLSRALSLQRMDILSVFSFFFDFFLRKKCSLRAQLRCLFSFSLSLPSSLQYWLP
jgi:hypothetical protein